MSRAAKQRIVLLVREAASRRPSDSSLGETTNHDSKSAGRMAEPTLHEVLIFLLPVSRAWALLSDAYPALVALLVSQVSTESVRDRVSLSRRIGSAAYCYPVANALGTDLITK
ncbi:MAG: hypothetical protein QOI77_3652 [Blastocatellia bacterium]|nr:hypothetical protein [Blastocatellia bacterium]